MSDKTIKKVKVSIKGEGKILAILKDVIKTDNLKIIRDKNPKITQQYHFADGEDLIDFDIEADYEVGELIDSEGKLYIISNNNLNNNKTPSKTKDSNETKCIEDSVVDNKKESKEEINNEAAEPVSNKEKQKKIEKQPEEEEKQNLDKDLIDLINQLSDSKKELQQKTIKIFEENGIGTINDLLFLNKEDIDALGLQLVFKRKLLDELEKLKPKPKEEGLTDNEKTLIKTIFEQDLPPEIIYNSIGASLDLAKQDLIKKYYFTLKKPVKPIPYHLKRLTVKSSEKILLPCFKYPTLQYNSKRYFTLLVMGETGSGKSTLLDAFVNYLANINYEDPWRYKLVDENDIADLDPGKSQTSVITSYYVNYQREDGEEINIKIVDTPGLGDTSGVLKDNEIIKQFEQFFQSTLELDYILVTIKASTTRWTHANQYVYDRVQEIFGKDAKERFIVMCTFADGQEPLAIGALKGKLHYEDYFSFNNSALYIPSDSSNSKNNNTKFFWKLGMENVKRFLNEILKKDLPPLSLRLSKQVMSKRNWLYENVKSSQKRVNEGFKMLDKSKELLDAIKKNKKLIDENGSFTHKVVKKIPRTVYLDINYQFCDNCKQICCQFCKWPQNEPYSMCTYFDPNSCHYNGGGCPKCPGHCNRKAHSKANKYIVYDEKEEMEVIKAKKDLYDDGRRKLSTSDLLLNETIEKMRKEGENMLKEMKEIKNSLDELDKIALKPRVLTNVEYFQQMIDFENEKKRPGYSKRIEGLKIMKEQAEQLNKLSNANDITQLFPTFNNIITELKTKTKTNCLIF